MGSWQRYYCSKIKDIIELAGDSNACRNIRIYSDNQEIIDTFVNYC